MTHSHNDGGNNRVIVEVRKRKRIKRIKTFIIITVFILFLIPTLLYILLGIRLSNLQKQVNKLMSANVGKSNLDEYDDENYAYAYEMNENETDNNYPDKPDYDKTNAYSPENNILKKDGTRL